MAIILIVDDDKTFLLSLVEGLRAHDQEFEIRTAENGKIATQILKDESVDLIITDLKMPVMDGFELLAYMSSHHPRIPVIVMTAYGTPVIENSVSHLGAIRYLEKPLDFDLLVDNIYNIVKPFDDVDVPGIQLTSFLKLLQMEKKTCVLTIRNQNQKGKMFLKKGALIHAIAPSSSGETAVMEILGWGQSEIQISSKTFSVEKNIQHDLDFIMMVLESRQRSAHASEPVQPSAESTYDIELGNIFNVGEEVAATASSEEVPAATMDALPSVDQKAETTPVAILEASGNDQPAEEIWETETTTGSPLSEESLTLETETNVSPSADEDRRNEEAATVAATDELAGEPADESMPERADGLPEEIPVPIDESSAEVFDQTALSAENPVSEGKTTLVEESFIEPSAQDIEQAETELPEEKPVLLEEPEEELPTGNIPDTEIQVPEDHSIATGEESIGAESVSGEEDERPLISQAGGEHLTNILAGKENGMNVKKMNEAVDALRETAGAGLLSCDVFMSRDGQSIVGFNSNPAYCAMSTQITDYMKTTLKEAGFPALGTTYMIDLLEDKMVITMVMGDYQWGMLIDTKKCSLGMLLNVALPRAKAIFESALAS